MLPSEGVMDCEQMIGVSASLILFYKLSETHSPRQSLCPIPLTHTNTERIASKILNLSISYLTGC